MNRFFARIQIWKLIAIVLVIFTLCAGLLFDVPRKPILNESIRNLYFHVPMWFGMVIIMATSAFYAIKFLQKNDIKYDFYSESCARVGLLFGVLGLITGMLWAKYTWGAYWSGDPKQNVSAIGILIYAAYIVLRGSINDDYQRARVGGIYNILAFSAFIPLIFVLPRLTDSLHPGNGGNPGFNIYDVDNRMRLIFYPAVIAWTMLGFWIINLRYRHQILQLELDELEDD